MAILWKDNISNGTNGSQKHKPCLEYLTDRSIFCSISMVHGDLFPWLDEIDLLARIYCRMATKGIFA